MHWVRLAWLEEEKEKSSGRKAEQRPTLPPWDSAAASIFLRLFSQGLNHFEEHFFVSILYLYSNFVYNSRDIRLRPFTLFVSKPHPIRVVPGTVPNATLLHASAASIKSKATASICQITPPPPRLHSSLSASSQTITPSLLSSSQNL